MTTPQPGMKITITIFMVVCLSRDAYFIVGGVKVPASTNGNNGQNEQMCVVILCLSPYIFTPPFSSRQPKGRVKALTSSDGQTLLNLFYLPHLSEVNTHSLTYNVSLVMKSINRF